jgi:hypothetical protein
MSAESSVPPFIRRQLDNYPILPGEDRRELASIFRMLAFSAGEAAQTAVEYTLVFRVSVLTFEVQRLECMRAKLVRHHHHAAVLELVMRTFKPHAERGSMADAERKLIALDFFKSDAEKQSVVKMITEAGYEADAVEVEAFVQALPNLVILDRQISTAQRHLLSLFKELDRRFARRAKSIQAQSHAIIAGARSGKPAAREAS